VSINSVLPLAPSERKTPRVTERATHARVRASNIMQPNVLGSIEPMAEEDEIVCSVCMDSIDRDGCTLPGCGHHFHCVCMLNFAQYDTKCPTCRQLPTGVVVRRHINMDDTVVVELDILRDRVAEARRTWSRYYKRRSAFIRKHPDMRELNVRIRTLQSEINGVTRVTQRSFDQKCNVLWKTDEELQLHKRSLTNLERRQRRLSKKLNDALLSHIGPRPDPQSSAAFILHE